MDAHDLDCVVAAILAAGTGVSTPAGRVAAYRETLAELRRTRPGAPAPEPPAARAPDTPPGPPSGHPPVSTPAASPVEALAEDHRLSPGQDETDLKGLGG